jgi:predicted nucleic acid-binding protein
LIIGNRVEIICLSEIAEIEFCSALWKKVRTGEAEEASVKEVIKAFKNDYQKFLFIGFDSDIKNQSINLLEKYSGSGIKTLDSIQLASALMARELEFANHFECADKLLNNFMKLEGLI